MRPKERPKSPTIASPSSSPVRRKEQTAPQPTTYGAVQKTPVADDGKRLDDLEKRMRNRVRVYRVCAMFYERLYVSLAVLSSVLTSAIVLIQLSEEPYRILVAALAAAATVLTGITVYLQAESNATIFKNALGTVKGYVEDLRMVRRLHIPGTGSKQGQEIERIKADYRRLRTTIVVPQWLFLRALQAFDENILDPIDDDDDDDDDNNDPDPSACAC